MVQNAEENVKKLTGPELIKLTAWLLKPCGDTMNLLLQRIDTQLMAWSTATAPGAACEVTEAMIALVPMMQMAERVLAGIGLSTQQQAKASNVTQPGIQGMIDHAWEICGIIERMPDHIAALQSLENGGQES